MPKPLYSALPGPLRPHSAPASRPYPASTLALALPLSARTESQCMPNPSSTLLGPTRTRPYSAATRPALGLALPLSARFNLHLIESQCMPNPSRYSAPLGLTLPLSTRPYLQDRVRLFRAIYPIVQNSLF